MGRVKASVTVPGRAAQAESVWYDRSRWASWIDGFGHLVSLEEAWPGTGARRVWDAKPPPQARRGRVVEHVLAHETRTGQTLGVEDEHVEGREDVAFAPEGDGVRVTLTRTWSRKGGGGPFGLLADALVERPRVQASLRATLARFAAERRSDADPGLTG